MGKSSQKKKTASENIGAGKGDPASLRNSDDALLPIKSLVLRTKKDTYYLAASVSLITFLVYFPSLQNGFVEWDDPDYVSENPNIYSLNAAFLKWAFSSFHATNWHPLTWISHALDYALWGLNPLGHHLTNNILHAINTFFVVVLVARLVEAAKPLTTNDSPFTFHVSRFTFYLSPFTLIAAATTGLLFGLHPLHVESVAWVAERKDLLCALFFLLSILAYVAHRAERIAQSAKSKEQSEESTGSTPCAMRYALCFFILALLSKPMAVTLPAVLLILDWYPFNRIQSVKSLWTACIGKIPFFALSIISSVLTVLAQSKAIHSLEVIPLSARLSVSAVSIITYLIKMVLPVNLIPFYPYPKDVSLASLEYLSAIILVAGITAACMFAMKNNRLFLSGWGYYVITLIPVLGIVQVGDQAMADRYTYLPSLGPFLITGLGMAWVLTWVQRVRPWGTILARAAAAAAVVVFVSLSGLTIHQIGVWKNSIGLWTYVLEKEPGLPFAYDNRGNAYRSEGQLDKAMEDFNRSIAVNPSYYKSYNNRGAVYSEMGQLDKAMEDFNNALALNPRCDEAYNNRGMVYGKTGSYDRAIEAFNRSLEIKPDYPLAYSNRGLAYSLIGDYERALKDFNKAIELDTRYAAAYGNRGNLYLRTGSRELALSDFQKACDLGDQGACAALKMPGE